MKILRLHRVEYFVNDVEEAEVNFSKLLNTRFIDHQEQTRPFGSLSLMNIDLGTELVAPVPGGVLDPVLEANGQGILTIVYEVEDINDTRDYLLANGFEILNDAVIPVAGGEVYHQISLSASEKTANIVITYLQVMPA
ncbi:hypothetical protein IMCC14465_09110 [alpha proteobacterium IMCC14465]|uniref:VOC domain-containing protein n=1 Tax=alpha proteobacterium IMCC14465 TaxID=1220535 RepID=J9A454_9PROT|nr:hypothetical protein IMCC14465_09110 [alpha proteobacterium IMCC14465]